MADIEPTIASVMHDALDHKTRAELVGENEQLRQIISASASAIGNGAFIAPTCSLEFMAGLPNEIALATSSLRTRISDLERERDEARDALQSSMALIDRVMHVHVAPDECTGYVGASRMWFMQNGGTLASIAEQQDRNRAAIRALQDKGERG